MPQRHGVTEIIRIALFLFLFVELKRANEIFRFNDHIVIKKTKLNY